MGMRRKARETTVQILYMFDYRGAFNEELLTLSLDNFSVADDVRKFAEKLICGVFENLEEIDKRLTHASENWSLSRMSKVDRAILRVAAYEIIFVNDIPTNVSINEAIEIAKSFGNEESRQFINGVLDKVAANFRRQSAIKEEEAA